jgi:hypothetical protein
MADLLEIHSVVSEIRRMDGRMLAHSFHGMHFLQSTLMNVVTSVPEQIGI